MVSRPNQIASQQLTHAGWPYPANIALASHLESVVRVNGGIPATIGILNGIAKVGLTPEEIIELTESIDKQRVWKISRRDLGFITGMVKQQHSSKSSDIDCFRA